MKNGLWLLTFGLLLMACEHPVIEKSVGKYDNGQTKMIQYFEQDGDEQRLIEEKQFHEDGKIKMEGKYEDGEREGVWKAYFRNGQLQSEGIFKAGKREGYSKVYYPNGNLMYEGQYSNNEKAGHWKFYNESGELKQEKEF